VSQLLRKVFTLSRWQQMLPRATSTVLLLWHKELLPAFLDHLYGCPAEATR
jgi:hypothetical protein